MLLSLLVACRSRGAAQDLCAQLVGAAGGEVLGEATDWASVPARAASWRPDVLLLEHAEADEACIWQMLDELKGGEDRDARPRVLLLCDRCTDATIVGAVQRGASGCLLASSAPPLQVRGVVAVHRGEAWFGRQALLDAMRSQIAPRPRLMPEWPDDQALLTVREREVLGLIGKALSNKEIARRLKISDNTVKTHLHHIYVKLNQSGRYRAFLSSAGPRLGPLSGRAGGPVRALFAPGPALVASPSQAKAAT